MEKECTSFELTLNDDEYLTSVFLSLVMDILLAVVIFLKMI